MKSRDDAKNAQKNYITDLSMTDRFTEEAWEEESRILQSEIEAPLKSIGRSTAPGTNEIPIQLFQALDDNTVRALTRICQRIWTTWQWSADWKRPVYIPIPKKADNKICDNYCTIALISRASKVMLKIIQQRFVPYLEREMPEVHAGFRKGRGTRDLIANIRWILKRTKEHQNKANFCFIDYSKAFDSVDQEKVWNVSKDMGVPQHLIILMHNLYSRQEATIRTEYGETELFPIGKGAHQG